MPHPHVRAAFINAIAEEGTKAEAVEWLQTEWNENCALRAALEIIAGRRQCVDNLISNVEVAVAALDQQ